MAIGHLEGIVGVGATGTYEFRELPSTDIPPNSSGQYIVTYQAWVFFAGETAYKVFVNGIEPNPGWGFRYGTAAWILDPFKYDCINGACIPSSTYNTPGIYQSLSECEIACGTGCNGKCISNAEWSKIEGLSSQLRNKNCS
ncbi:MULTISPECIES: hypothetical protein [Calothrix]|uniref:Uncharacterized protein n=2 Tax=Calothrix TaxID=1186 RepID=A0ABR8ADA8_9CYAN|nr:MULTISPECIES: hypothetical protein [Calothrix]MBD2197941.1 hypothetical protein [Calothrix parietina FACHB-288]MBD2226774.1 hypothetical protein [Calothrix anomala FACHB-343]